MAQCLNCSKRGLLLSVDRNGLCQRCREVVSLDVSQRSRIINDCVRLVEEGKTLATRVSRCDLLIEHLRELEAYERKGVRTIEPSASQLLSKFVQRRTDLIFQGAEEVASKAIMKAELAASAKQKISTLSGAIAKIKEMGIDFRVGSALSAVEAKLGSFCHRTRLEGFLEDARKAEFKGNLKRAIDQYQEALYFLRNDQTPDEHQALEIQRLEAKLVELSQKA